MTETALERLVSQTEINTVVEDAIARLLFEFKQNPQNREDGFMPVQLIANAIGEELRWVEPALERMKARVLVEQSPLVRAFRMTPEGVARDRCAHSPECLSSIDCAARDAAPSSTQVATEQPTMPKMPKKTKPPEEQRDDNFGAKLLADEEKRYAEERAARAVERELMREGARALLALAAEQTLTLRAQRFLAFAEAVAALKTLGDFPAVELIHNAALNELTVLSRELHNVRVAGAR